MSLKTTKNLLITLLLLFSFGLSYGQSKKDSTNHIPLVNVESHLDINKYLWNLLKHNNKQTVQDTSIYYSIDLKIDIPDSNYFESFKGVILAEYIDNKCEVYICEGDYVDNNPLSILDFKPMSIGFSEFKNLKFKKKHFKKKHIKYDRFNQSFIISEGDSLFTSSFKFKNKSLSNKETISYKISKLLAYRLTFNEYNVEYYKYPIPKTSFAKFSHYHKETKYTSTYKLEAIKNGKFEKKAKINYETPSSLNRKLTNVK